MAFYDWNHDGKNNRQDDCRECEIYIASTDQNNGNSNKVTPTGDPTGGGCLGWCMVFLIIALILG